MVFVRSLRCRWRAEGVAGPTRERESRTQGGRNSTATLLANDRRATAEAVPQAAHDEVASRLPAHLHYQGKVRIIQAGPGSVIGEVDWVLRRPRSFQCLAVSKATVMCLSRAAHERMARSHPHANVMLLQMLLRSSMLSTLHAMHALEQAVR
jgi:hypothetical protein